MELRSVYYSLQVDSLPPYLAMYNRQKIGPIQRRQLQLFTMVLLGELPYQGKSLFSLKIEQEMDGRLNDVLGQN